uniref:Uncharacterized protein n=1 Tax=Brassica campestris TaxID=3711 RepID=A0A3P5Z542_BRACM|nr:unnamed protein product [Brassica rapa]
MDRKLVRSICRQLITVPILIAHVTTSTCYVRSSVIADVTKNVQTLHLHRSRLVK